MICSWIGFAILASLIERTHWQKGMNAPEQAWQSVVPKKIRKKYGREQKKK